MITNPELKTAIYLCRICAQHGRECIEECRSNPHFGAYMEDFVIVVAQCEHTLSAMLTGSVRYAELCAGACEAQAILLEGHANPKFQAAAVSCRNAAEACYTIAAEQARPLVERRLKPRDGTPTTSPFFAKPLTAEA